MIKNIIVGSGNTTALETPENEQYAILSMFFCNTSTVDNEFIDIYCVPEGEAPANKHKIVHLVEIPVKDTFVIDTEKIVLSSGDKLVVKGQVGNIVSATVSYINY